MGWNRNLLTDSGGFQMVSLLQLAKIDETGVNFQSPYDGSHCMLTPEHSIEIQNSIGADIMMQLDDVVKTTLTGARVEEAMYRCGNRLDCIKIKQQKKCHNKRCARKTKLQIFAWFDILQNDSLA